MALRAACRSAEGSPPPLTSRSSIGSQRASLIWGDGSDAAEHHLPASTLPIAVLDDEASNAARLHPDAETLDGSIAGIPDKDIAALALNRANGIDSALGKA